MRIILAILVLLCMGAASSSFAQRHAGKSVSLHVLRGLASVIEVNNNEGEVPPLPKGEVFPEIEHVDAAPPRSLQVRVDNMVSGILLDIPPEYDRYGYEIRRFMARIEDPEVYVDADRRLEELGNIAQAQMTLRAWQGAMGEERITIDGLIEERGATSSVYRSLKYNQSVIDAFLVELKAWLDYNQALLELLHESSHEYAFANDSIAFEDPQLGRMFLELYMARNKATQRMRKYPLFREVMY